MGWSWTFLKQRTCFNWWREWSLPRRREVWVCYSETHGSEMKSLRVFRRDSGTTPCLCGGHQGWLLFGSKAMTNLDSILESRDITLPTKVHMVKAMVFLVVMYGCKSWTIKKAEHWRTDAFEPWCWRRLFRVSWTARSKQLILKENNPKYSLEGLIVKLKLQYFGHLMQRANSSEKTDAGKDWGHEEKGVTEDEMIWRHHGLNEHEFEQTPVDNEGQSSLACCSPWGHKEWDMS